jgi:hypothetical protein
VGPACTGSTPSVAENWARRRSTPKRFAHRGRGAGWACTVRCGVTCTFSVDGAVSRRNTPLVVGHRTGVVGFFVTTSRPSTGASTVTDSCRVKDDRSDRTPAVRVAVDVARRRIRGSLARLRAAHRPADRPSPGGPVVMAYCCRRGSN